LKLLFNFLFYAPLCCLDVEARLTECSIGVAILLVKLSVMRLLPDQRNEEVVWQMDYVHVYRCVCHTWYEAANGVMNCDFRYLEGITSYHYTNDKIAAIMT